ncbi:hypothetical protein K456DRAFT_271948 [Colletotrichum gloeosporioides 23]|nr:hypothetical protein K456DRAFT_271948 [Colletotrichum gloeosporioides 23]
MVCDWMQQPVTNFCMGSRTKIKAFVLFIYFFLGVEYGMAYSVPQISSRRSLNRATMQEDVPETASNV